MATIQHRSYDKTVANIPERNAISPRRPGMTVLVRDAIGDPYAGSGRAVYRWDEVQASWILMFKDNVETLTFTGESKTISQDQIQLSFVPANGQVWDVMVRDGLVAHQVEHSVAGSVVTIQPDTPGQFDGKQLSVRYAYGTMTQQLDLEIARVVGEAVGVFDKEAVGLGNVDNTSDLDKPISTATQRALDGKEASGTAATALSAHTGAVDPHSQYLPKAGGTMSGSISFAPAQTWPTFNQSTTGNAATATKLETERALTIGSNSKTFDGSSNLSWSLSEIGAQAELVSGTNIRTINGQSVLGAGDLTVGLTYFTESYNNSAPNAPVPVAGFSATGAATNIDFALMPKGAGALTAQVANNAVSGGSKRGYRSVDLQMGRTAATQVASGNYSVAMGYGNTASADYAVAMGYGNTASGWRAVAFGENNTASADYAVAMGYSNLASSTYSCVPGGAGARAESRGVLAYGFYGQAGRNQMSFWGGRNETTTSSAARITADAAAASAANQLTLRNSSAFRVCGTVVARNTSTNDCKEWTFEALIKRGANAAATAIVGTPSITSTFADTNAASWGIAVTADTTNGALAITATGAASTSIRWTAVVHSIEVA